MRNAADKRKTEYKILEKKDELYPKHLKSISDAPARLYYIGNPELIQKPGIAIVGTRRASPYGRWVAYEIGKRVAGCGIPVISGMAYGVDAIAHRACLDADMGTVAVLGTGIDVPFPQSNIDLYYDICERGLVVSELPPGTPAMRYNFPNRNRIISGLSSRVIVAEGAYKSGSMITARLALDQGREVFAVPGNINQPASKGVNSLIADGAHPITDLDELPLTLGIKGNQLKMAVLNASEDELMLIDLLRNNPGITADELAALSNYPAAFVLAKISNMELKGLVRCDGRRIYFDC